MKMYKIMNSPLLVTGLTVALVGGPAISGCQSHDHGSGGPTKAPSKKQDGHVHGDDDHDHGEESVRYDAKLLASIKGRRCEHKVPIMDCDECRYEVGVVQLSAAFHKAGKGELVKTGKPTTSGKPVTLRLNGEVAFDEQRVVHVSARIGGVARRVFVTTGDRVKVGAPLVEMDSVELGKLRSSYLQAQARLKLTRENYEREKKLHEDQIASAKDRLLSETAFQEAKIALQAARDQLRLVGATAAAAKGKAARSGRVTLRAPLAGVVTAKHTVPGERIPAGQEILTVADLSVVWVWASVYERDLAPLLAARSGGKLKAAVQVSAFAGKAFGGEVDYVGATMDEATRTVKVRVVVGNEDALLRPGMFATVSVELGAGAPALVLPAEAVVSDAGQRFVFVRIGKNRFLRRDVTTGAERGGTVEITGGLGRSDQVVVKGAFLLKSDILREKMGAGCAD